MAEPLTGARGAPFSRRACPPRSTGAYAVLTPPGRGGIAVIRCIGPGAAGALEACFRPPSNADFGTPHSPLPSFGCLAYGHVLDGQGRPLDEIILYRQAQDRFEVNCHGGPAAVKAVSARLAELGLEPVSADRLLELEGAAPLVRQARAALRSARTPAAARVLLDQLNGALEAAVRRADAALAAGRTPEALRTLDELLRRWRCLGRHLADPPRIVIAGRPSCGKSTLVNRLLGAERVITSAVPGTTRDFVDAEASLEGLPVVLVDTAGLRQTTEAVEREGVERARGQLARAAVVVYLLDATRGAAPDDRAAIAALGSRAVCSWNKADLVRGPLGEPASLAISALTGQGVGALVAAILEKLDHRAAAPGEAVPFAAAQAEALEAARAAASGDPVRARQRLLALFAQKSE